MNIRELCSWLREHSSGVYRPCADAAALIEQLSVDAARYQWIRKDWVQPNTLDRWVPRHPTPQASGSTMWGAVYTEVDYDAAVDRARKARHD